MNQPLLRNAGNARRQRAHRVRKSDAGLVPVTVWLSFDTMQNLRALAYKRRVSQEAAIAQAINGEWETAGSP
jgi:hypothetical protein